MLEGPVINQTAFFLFISRSWKTDTIFMVKIILISHRPCLSILTWDLRYKLKNYEISQQIRTIYALGEKETSKQDVAN